MDNKNLSVALQRRSKGAQNSQVLFFGVLIGMVSVAAIFAAVILVQGAAKQGQAGQVEIETQEQLFAEEFTDHEFMDTEVTTANWDQATGILSAPNSQVQGEISVAQSVSASQDSNPILAVTLQAATDPQLGVIKFEVTNDGKSFVEALQGVPVVFKTMGSDLRWRVTITRGSQGIPRIDAIELNYTTAKTSL